ncbi:MAG: hypothetical protein ACTSR4_05320, partial [Candidatus Hodarchaeales archaeon]
MKDLIAKEIIGLHQFFENWYSAEVDNTSAEFNRFESVLHKDFEIIIPSGGKMEKLKLLELIKGEYGKFKAFEKFSITIEDIDYRFIGSEMSLVTYKEIGISEDGPKHSLITAVFRRNPELINGVEWLHIHET